MVFQTLRVFLFWQNMYGLHLSECIPWLSVTLFVKTLVQVLLYTSDTWCFWPPEGHVCGHFCCVARVRPSRVIRCSHDIVITWYWYSTSWRWGRGTTIIRVILLMQRPRTSSSNENLGSSSSTSFIEQSNARDDDNDDIFKECTDTVTKPLSYAASDALLHAIPSACTKDVRARSHIGRDAVERAWRCCWGQGQRSKKHLLMRTVAYVWATARVGQILLVQNFIRQVLNSSDVVFPKDYVTKTTKSRQCHGVPDLQRFYTDTDAVIPILHGRQEHLSFLWNYQDVTHDSASN